MAEISKDQIKIIHTLKPKIAGLGDREAYELFLSNAVGRMVRSCTDLNRDEAARVTQIMIDLAGRSGTRSQKPHPSGELPKPPRSIGALSQTTKSARMARLARRQHHTRPAVPTVVTEEQLNLIQRAAALRGWNQPTLDQFILRQTKHERILTKWDFERVFWALKRMNDHDGFYARDQVPDDERQDRIPTYDHKSPTQNEPARQRD